MPKNQTQLVGIVVAGDTLEQAKDHYRAVATGNDVAVLESEDGSVKIATAANSGLQLLNPIDGNELVESELDAEMKSLSSASEGGVFAEYVQCTNGCQSHVIASSVELLKKCPACASNLPNIKGNDVKDETILAFASTFEEASEQYANLVQGETEVRAFECANVVVACASEMSFDIYQGIKAQATSASVKLKAVASNADGEIEANHFVCSSKSCKTHVLASNDSPLFCPACSGGLIDPADVATASDDNDYEEEDEEFEEEEFEDDGESEDDYEEDEDYDDEDDAITLSVSSATYGGGVRRKEKSKEMVSVAASFVALSANEMEFAKVDVAYAGNVAGEPTWVAFYEGTPFAKATASTSKVENFASDLFGRSFAAIAAEQGVSQAMQELGFVEIKPQINVDQYVQGEVNSQVETRVADIAKASARDAEEFNDRFLAAIATASQGINRGFYKNLQNPVRVALATALEEAGIVGAEQLVNKAFAKYGDDYHKQLVAKACEIMRYDLDVQNQIANAVAEHQNPQDGAEVSVSSAIPVGRPLPNQQKQNIATASTKSTTPNDFNAKLSKLTFGRR